MRTEGYFPCPDCGALLWVPMTIETGDSPVEMLVSVSEDEAEQAYDRHVAFNPDLHAAANHPPE